MSYVGRGLLKSLCLVVFGFSVFAHASESWHPTQGVDYVVVPKFADSVNYSHDPSDVKEFFSFACIHCKIVESVVETKLLTNKNIKLHKIQVPWNDAGDNYAKLNATIEYMHLNRLYTPAFNAILSGGSLGTQSELLKFLQQNHLNQSMSNKFLATYNSFGVSSRAALYKTLSQDYQIDATPTFIVDNKYKVIPSNPDKMIQVILFLAK